MKTRSAKRMATVAAFSALIAAAPAAPAFASAHQMSPPDGGGYGRVESGHQAVSACDTSANDRGVFVRYVTSNPNDGRQHTLRDTDGSSGGCGVANVGPYVITSYQVCSIQTGGTNEKCTSEEWISGR